MALHRPQAHWRTSTPNDRQRATERAMRGEGGVEGQHGRWTVCEDAAVALWRAGGVRGGGRRRRVRQEMEGE